MYQTRVSLFLIAGLLFYFVYLNHKKILEWFSNSKSTKTIKSTNNKSLDPLPSNIVLVKILHTQSSDEEYALMWNGHPITKQYKYQIIDKKTGMHIANSSTISSSSITKIKGIHLVPGTLYEVIINDTKVEAIFSPPDIFPDKTITGENVLEIRTNVMPTHVEVIKDGFKIEEKYIGIYGEPEPGIRVDFDISESKEIVSMIYNGPNVATILVSNQ